MAPTDVHTTTADATRTRRRLPESPAATGRRVSLDPDAVLPEELLSGSDGQILAAITAYREGVDVVTPQIAGIDAASHGMEQGSAEVWCAGDPSQARSVAHALGLLGITASLGEGFVGPRGKRGIALVTPRWAVGA